MGSDVFPHFMFMVFSWLMDFLPAPQRRAFPRIVKVSPVSPKPRRDYLAMFRRKPALAHSL
ncbi:MAG: hypothetical protein LRY36_02175 [Alphaproteobacteria bacterium]|nr:hypothetical protein [Alphaproteobacteria bacterium]